MPYVIDRYQSNSLDPGWPVIVQNNAIDMTSTSLKLVGRDSQNFGEHIMENFVHLLENFAGPNAPANPITGQLWYDTSIPELKIWTGSSWSSIATGGGGGSLSVVPLFNLINTNTTVGTPERTQIISGSQFREQTHVVNAGASDVTITIANSVNTGDRWRFIILPTQTGNVTIQPQTPGQIEGGRASDFPSVVVAQNNVMREVIIECYDAAGPSFRATGDILFDERLLFGGDFRIERNLTITGSLGEHGSVENEISGPYTTSVTDRGNILVYSGAGDTITVDPATFPPVSKLSIINLGTGTLTINTPGGNSVTLNPPSGTNVEGALVYCVTKGATTEIVVHNWTGVRLTAPSGPPPPPPSPCTSEIPDPPVVTVSVTNTTELQNAINSATPGTHIILEDGTYGSVTIPETIKGTGDDPIVIRARNNFNAIVTGYWQMNVVTTGVTGEVDADVPEHIWIYGLRFDQTGGLKVNGKGVVVRRCWFSRQEPSTLPPGAQPEDNTIPYARNALRIEYCDDTLIDYCTFEAPDLGAWIARGWKGPNYPSDPSDIIKPKPSGGSSRGGIYLVYKSSGIYSTGIRIRRCLWTGGAGVSDPDIAYSWPKIYTCILYTALTRYQNQPTSNLRKSYDLFEKNWWELDPTNRYRPVSHHATGGIDKQIVVNNANSPWEGLAFRNARLNIAEGINSNRTVIFSNGPHFVNTVNPDTQSVTLYAGYWPEDEILVPHTEFYPSTGCTVHNISNGYIRVGQPASWPHPARGNELYNVTVPVNLINETGTIQDPNQVHAASPVTLTFGECGHTAPFAGHEEDDWI